MKDNLYVGDYVECTLKYFHKNDPVSKTAHKDCLSFLCILLREK